MANKTYLILGISRGLGKAIAQHIPTAQDQVWGVSRSKPAYLNEYPQVNWVQADLSQPLAATKIMAQALGDRPLDALIYNVGIWEQAAFTEEYSFENSPPEEILNLIQTNLSSCLLLIQAMLSNLKQSSNAKVILIGSTWGLDNHHGKEVAFSATKFALRGAAHALRENLRSHQIGVSVLNLGYLATELEGLNDVAQVIAQTQGALIPLPDVLAAIRFILSTSPASCVKEIHMPAMLDTNV